VLSRVLSAASERWWVVVVGRLYIQYLTQSETESESNQVPGNDNVRK
jgi:hypothetical protein